MLLDVKDRFPEWFKVELDFLSRASKTLVKKREISLYGGEEAFLTPEDVISEELSEITLNMRLQAWLLAPLTCGIVVALMAVITQILIQIEGLYEKLSTSISSASEIGATVFSQFINFGKLVGPWLFQMVVGIYMIEVVLILSYFVTKIEHGEEPVIRNYEMGKTLLVAILIYTVLTLVVYYSLSSVARMIV